MLAQVPRRRLWTTSDAWLIWATAALSCVTVAAMLRRSANSCGALSSTLCRSCDTARLRCWLSGGSGRGRGRGLCWGLSRGRLRNLPYALHGLHIDADQTCQFVREACGYRSWPRLPLLPMDVVLHYAPGVLWSRFTGG